MRDDNSLAASTFKQQAALAMNGSEDDPPSLGSFREARENEDVAAAGLRHSRGPWFMLAIMVCGGGRT
jgi:hypothetical protein